MPHPATGRRIRLPDFADPVTVDSVDIFDGVAFLQVRTQRGEPKDATVDEATLATALATAEGPASATFVRADDLFLLVESARIRLAYAWDPYFAVSLSGIEALPHQLEAVYDHMLPQARLRFLLADDPGAGKTIMAGLLLKELRLRGAVERILILAPAPLTLQWQDEMRSKFDEVFERVDSHLAREQLGGSPWSRFRHCVTSVDFAKQDHIAPDLLKERWDLVIVDEAHKVSMPSLDHPTMRFKLARALAERCERLLLMTATPHSGNPEQFRNLLSLLDEHAFRSEEAVKRLLEQEDNPWLLRRMKEDMHDFQGRRLFVRRHAYTEEFTLNEHEYALYDAVTDYINEFLPKQSGRRKASAALARMVLQRRLASSLRAIRVSLERRYDRLHKIQEELDGMDDAQRTRRLRELANLPVDPEMDPDDETEDAMDEAAEQATLAARYEDLVREVAELELLVGQARATEQRGQESKLDRLFQCLGQSQFDELREAGGKLLIFTEHRATLDCLREKLERAGYRCCEIHGGMSALSRKEAQVEFHARAQICIATEAAGEGINLQFCHLMINYDMPWNPNRLEQRMGRIHRFGQEREVHVFNFVATGGPRGPEAQPVVEGRILATLMRKVGEIGDSLGDRVFDVIGMLLRVHGVNLEDLLREASYNPRMLEDYVERIEQMGPDKLERYEASTHIALARRNVDLSRIRGQDFASEEKRLMPEYVEDYFLAAAERTGLRVMRRANPALLRIETVPQKFLARSLVAIRERGEPDKSYPKSSFRKDELKKSTNLDGVMLSPGHPLYAVVDEVSNLSLRDLTGGTARFLDPYARGPYRLHFYEVVLEGESLGDPGEPARTVPVHALLVVVQEEPDGSLSLAQPDILHDLTPIDPERGSLDLGPWQSPPDAEALRLVQRWIQVKVQHPTVVDRRQERAREVEIRRVFLTASFKASVAAAQRKQMELTARVLAGDTDASLARDNARTRLAELEATREHRMRALDHLSIVRAGRVAHLGSVQVSPPPASSGASMRRDPEVEQRAVAIAIKHEKDRGWEVEEVWQRMDSSGFDLRSTGPADENGVRLVRRIEVKGRAAPTGEVHLSPNEWRKAERLRDTYWLYVVWGCKTGRPVLKTIHDPWGRLRGAAREVVEVKGWRIPHEALDRIEGETWPE